MQIGQFRKLGEMGNIGIAFDEMDVESIVQKLHVIEQRSDKIWDAFDKHFKRGFFYD